jgi:uncharacterized protein YbaA (DUF1428 family)
MGRGARNDAHGVARVFQVAPVIRRGKVRDDKHEAHEMAYVDGFVVPVPKTQVEAYRRMARKSGKVWREHGALAYFEWVADDVPYGKRTSFPRSVKLKPDETVVFSWILYKSRRDRDRINAKVMADPRLKHMDLKALPFDAKRMIWGGFKPLVSF